MPYAYICIYFGKQIEIGGKTITTKNILVATGGRPSILDVPGKDLPGVITSDQALVLPKLPEKMLIYGAGYIAVEFAGIFHAMGRYRDKRPWRDDGYSFRLILTTICTAFFFSLSLFLLCSCASGVEVHLAFRGEKVLRGFDEDLRDFLTESLTRKGIQLHPGYKIAGISQEGDLLNTSFSNGEAILTGNVMMATGRHPNTNNLGLEAVGVELVKGAIKVCRESDLSGLDSALIFSPPFPFLSFVTRSTIIPRRTYRRYGPLVTSQTGCSLPRSH